VQVTEVSVKAQLTLPVAALRPPLLTEQKEAWFLPLNAQAVSKTSWRGCRRDSEHSEHHLRGPRMFYPLRSGSYEARKGFDGPECRCGNRSTPFPRGFKDPDNGMQKHY